MSNAEEGSPEFEMCENGEGVILGFWDHEKTSALIQDLERSVSQIEDKCKQLLEELIYYKRCGEESRDLDRHPVRFESNSDIMKSSSLYGSEPDIVHRQSLINFQELQQVFEERFEQKLSGINKELTEVSRKIGLKNNVVLFPTKDYLKALNEQIEKDAQKSWCNNKEKFFKTYLFKGNAKSDSLIHQQGGGEGEFSKITKNELDLYQKLSSVSKGRKRGRKRRGKASASRGEKAKLSGRWTVLKLRQDLLPSKRKKPKSGKKICKKREKKIAVVRTASCSPRKSCSALLSLAKLSDSEIEKVSKLLSESVGKKTSLKSRKSRQGTRGGASVETRRSTTFTSCSAPLRTSEGDHIVGRPHNVKGRRPDLRTSASETIYGTKGRDVFSRSNSRGAILMNKGHPILRASSEIKNDLSKRRRNGRAKRKRKVWTTEKHSSQNMKKRQIKCTISLPRGFFEDTKSISNLGSKSSKKCRGRRAYTVNSKIRVSDYQSTNVWDDCKVKHNFEDASGDGSRNDTHARQTHKGIKTHSSFLHTKRKDGTQKNMLGKKNLSFVDKELQCLEKEIVCSLEKYKKFLQFYSTFLRKNHRTKPSKIDSEVTKFRPSKRRKLWELNPIFITAMKKAFRDVEAIQKKIKLWINE